MDRQQRILTYALREELGHDALGRVFRAWDTRTLRSVVLRLLRPAGLVKPNREEAVRAELRRRLRAAAQVAHPNLAAVIDLSQFRDLEVLVVEDYGGDTLAGRLARGAPAVEALRWSIEVCGAIARAHARDVPHGRISLANIIVARDDAVRVLDLGLPRPRQIPFLVEDEPEGDGTLKPAGLDLPKAMRRDLEALAAVVQSIVESGPEDAPDADVRKRIARAVAEATAAVRAKRAARVSMLHAALVDVARRTPADGRRAAAQLADGTLLAEPPSAEPPPQGYRVLEHPGAGTASEVRPVVEAGERGPFSMTRYDIDADSTLPGFADPIRPPALQVWGAAAFEAEKNTDAEPEDFEPLMDPQEPPVMTTVFLPPEPGGQSAVEPHEDEGPRRFRLWPHGAAAAAVGVLLAVALFSLESVMRAGGRDPLDAAVIAARDASNVRQPTPLGSSPPGLSAGGPGTARPGQASGTLVVTVSLDSVTVSINGSRPVPAPVTWDDVPASRHIVQVMRPGFVTRIDTVAVRPGLTTTRYYLLMPERTR